MTEQKAQMLLAEHDGIQWLKLVGDIRVSLCPTLEAGFEEVLQREPFGGLVVDLSETQGIDSTSLGMLVRFGARASENCGEMPVLMAPQQDIAVMLRHMGFERVFEICDRFPDEIDGMQEVAHSSPLQNGELRRKVIDAHNALISLKGDKSHPFVGVLKHLEEEE